MRICWDNLEKLKYKNGYWYDKNSHCYVNMNSCNFCSNDFLVRNDTYGLYCDKNCSSRDHGRKIKGKESKKKLTYEYVKEQIEKEGYVLVSKEYKNSSEEIKLRCNNGHEYLSTYDRFNSGKRCPICSNIKQFSKAEKEIAEYIKSFGLDIIENDRKQIINPLTNHPLEIDIFIPEYHKAIEFNGKYWHSRNDTKERDKIKKQECLGNGIDLLVIDEQDWIDSKNRCLGNIKEFINV